MWHCSARQREGGGLRGVAKRKQSYRCGDNGNRLCVQAYSFKLCDNLFILLSNLSSLFAIILLSAFTHRHTTTLAYYQQKASWKKLWVEWDLKNRKITPTTYTAHIPGHTHYTWLTCLRFERILSYSSFCFQPTVYRWRFHTRFEQFEKKSCVFFFFSVCSFWNMSNTIFRFSALYVRKNVSSHVSIVSILKSHNAPFNIPWKMHNHLDNTDIG